MIASPAIDHRAVARQCGAATNPPAISTIGNAACVDPLLRAIGMRAVEQHADNAGESDRADEISNVHRCRCAAPRRPAPVRRRSGPAPRRSRGNRESRATTRRRSISASPRLVSATLCAAAALGSSFARQPLSFVVASTTCASDGRSVRKSSTTMPSTIDGNPSARKSHCHPASPSCAVQRRAARRRAVRRSRSRAECSP